MLLLALVLGTPAVGRFFPPCPTPLYCGTRAHFDFYDSHGRPYPPVSRWDNFRTLEGVTFCIYAVPRR
jgi:hypothetical protein